MRYAKQHRIRAKDYPQSANFLDLDKLEFEEEKESSKKENKTGELNIKSILSEEETENCYLKKLTPRTGNKDEEANRYSTGTTTTDGSMIEMDFASIDASSQSPSELDPNEELKMMLAKKPLIQKSKPKFVQEK